ncbi:phage head spike fiber domain-containing protein [Sphingomonas sp. EC-HK361]|uniref:phage head spike fiber domain-containing protein n=1 Tax=Sphingomonas sp. EC-HK361 TaxID=2038397 RepID=UPI00125F5272|nr:hypothetical protein [Sphingomonas sp. EC-HK361]
MGIGSGRTATARAVGFDLGADALPAGVTLSRATPAMCFDAAGMLAVRAANAARFDHDPQTLARRGLLVEAAATNVLPWSSDLAGHWAGDMGGSGSAPIVTALDAVAPDGTNAATRIDFVRGDGFSRIALSGVGTVPGMPMVFSVWLKAAGAAGASIALRLESLDSGTLTLDGQWRRYSLAARADTDAASVQLLLWSQVAGAPTAAAVHAWGAQLETGTIATSSIATAGSVGTRSADTVTLDWGGRGVADGPITVRYAFDDGSSQTGLAMVSGGRMTVPTDLARARLLRVTRI